MTKLELLAPAKNLETGMAAVDAGADAIYIGSPKFGARSSAGNSVEDIAALCNYAHLFGVKVYVTLNTILYDDELEDARALVYELYDAGMDALIIQDMALLKMELPPVPIHASTQTNNRDAEKVKFLQDAGCQRVILARELNLKEIKEIRDKTEVELEFFIHGALCVSYSGQCYMSQSICGRSANRGECSQPCRSTYNLIDNNGKTLISEKHLLSLKDLNLSENIGDLAKAGICSFKIEGRLKDAAYVRNVVAFYRQKLDEVILDNPDFSRASSGESTFTFTPDPERSFHRGNTSYFVNQRSADMVTMNTQKSLGKFVGRIKKIGNNIAYVKAAEEIHNNDGLCFFDSYKQLQGFKVDRVEGDKLVFLSNVKLRVGAELYRNYDHEFNKAVERNGSAVRKIKAFLTISELPSGFLLKAIDEDGNEVESVLEISKEAAKNEERARDQIIKQLNKSGDTPFLIEAVSFELSQAWFLQASLLNNMRREVLQKLYDTRIQNYQRTERTVSGIKANYPKVELDFQGNVSNKLANAFYREHGVNEIETAFELKNDYRKDRLMTTRYCVLFEMDKCLKKQSALNSGLNLPLFLENNRKIYRLDFDCKKCEMHIVNDSKAKV
ncbi:MAG: U32 family peptidase [Bacteroidales bacterium]|nr:U32 family peptidase [Bacteroidales bacterium]